MYFSTLLSAAALVRLSIAGYALQDDYMQDFFGNFDFFTAADPTNGFVQYVDQSTAQSTGLINSTGSAITWGVDSTNETPNGRPSVRISSKKTYDTGLVILDVAHMPVGCGTWPAFWMVGPDWPTNGEIDILEGVNEQETNAMTLHTGPNCAISTSEGIFSGEVATSNCDVNAEDQSKNAGCSITSKDSRSYGAGLNDAQGGVYATQWTDEAISVYFFPRGSIPDDVTSGSPDPTGWGTPAAKFQGNCDIANTFKQQQIVFDTTFCGDWAGEVWSSGSCASKAKTCEAYVQTNPSAFADAYWTINSLKVYQDNGDETPAPGPSSVATVYPSSIASIIPTSEIPIPIPSLTVPVISGSTLAPPAIFTSAFSTIAPVPTIATSFDLGGGGGHSRSHRHSRSQDNNELAPTSAAPFPTSNSSGIATGPSAPAVTSDVPSSNAPPSSATAAPIASNRPGVNNNFPNGPMHEFAWPQAAGGNNNGGAASSSAPVAASSTAVGAPSTTLATATSAPAVPVPSTSQAAAAPTSSAPNRIVHTVYETLYVTVPATAPTPAARKARHVRQHRRRITQHHAARQ